jgi:general secretion pathway protein E
MGSVMTEHLENYNGFMDLARFDLDRELILKLDEKFCRASQVVLLGVQDDTPSSPVSLGMLDVSDEKTAFQVSTKINRKIRQVQLNAHEIEEALHYGFSDETIALQITGTTQTGHPPLILDCSRKIEFGVDPAATDMVGGILSEAITKRASDIHIETYENDVDVRFRVDGVLRQISTPVSPYNVKKVCSFMKVLADLDMAKHRIAQDGRITTAYRDENGDVRQIDLRISVLPGSYGEDLVLRVLDERHIALDVGDLGMGDAVYEQWKLLIHSPGGLIAVTGPTASGKTTTLYSAIRDINTDENKVLTVEDPIEYKLPRVSQKQVSERMSFADYSRAFMRQNPDILMIGEIRDEETAKISVRASQMGHLVFTTLHASDVFAGVSRLSVLGADKPLIAAGLLGVLSQRLVRKICPDCREPYEPAAEVFSRFPASLHGGSFTHGTGCDACDQTGYRGQTGAFEILVLDSKMRALMSTGADIVPADAPGFASMYDDAISKVEAGITTLEEVLRTVPLPGS